MTDQSSDKLRVATFRIDGSSRDLDGYLIVDARLSKTGVYKYQDSEGGTVREQRPSSEVFKPSSLASYSGVAVTRKHPNTFVSPNNHNILSVGTVLSATQTPPYVTGRIKITDSRTIEDIEAGRFKEISMGYRVRLDPAREDDKFDRVQRDLIMNHAALLPAGEGRLGTDVGLLRLDAADNYILTAEETMTDKEDRLDAEGSEEEKSSEEAPANEPEDKLKDSEEAPTDEPAPEDDNTDETDADEETPEEEAPADEEEPKPEEDEAPEATMELLNEKLDALLSFLTPSEDAADEEPEEDKPADETPEEKTDALDKLVEDRVAQALTVRAAHAKLCPGTKQDGRSVRELSLEALKRVDSDLDATKHEDSVLVDMVEVAAKSAKPTKSFEQRLLEGHTDSTDTEDPFVKKLLDSVSE